MFSSNQFVHLWSGTVFANKETHGLLTLSLRRIRFRVWLRHGRIIRMFKNVREFGLNLSHLPSFFTIFHSGHRTWCLDFLVPDRQRSFRERQLSSTCLFFVHISSWIYSIGLYNMFYSVRIHLPRGQRRILSQRHCEKAVWAACEQSDKLWRLFNIPMWGNMITYHQPLNIS